MARQNFNELSQELFSTPADIIWIDDCFKSYTSDYLFDLILSNFKSINENEKFKEYSIIISNLENGDDNAIQDLKQIISDLTDSDKEAQIDLIKSLITQNVPDLNSNQIDGICTALSIRKAENCFAFEDAQRVILEKSNSPAYYIVDLHNGSDNYQGLEIIKMIKEINENSIFFILSHEAGIDNESKVEQDLENKLLVENDKNFIPVCVISKSRLTNSSEVKAGLQIALKRAVLRKSVHGVLKFAEEKIVASLNSTIKELLRITPEELDKYVVKNAMSEGVSELHVLERVLNISTSENVRRLFGEDPTAIKFSKSLRAASNIELNLNDSEYPSDKVLHRFREKELWEGDYINSSFSAISCGDVFQEENGTKYLLLVQPCDVMVRSDGKRKARSGVFVKLDEVDPLDQLRRKCISFNNSTEMSKKCDALEKAINQIKTYKLPFLLKEKSITCDFSKNYNVSLDILDFAVLNKSGNVLFNKLQERQSQLLPGLTVIESKLFAKFTKLIEKIKTDNEYLKINKLIDINITYTELQLVEPYNVKDIKFSYGAFINDKDEISWKLKRIGRIRMPYAATIYKKYLEIIGREAFDMEYLK